MKKLFASFYFRDKDEVIRTGEIKIDPKNAHIEFQIDGQKCSVDPRRILVTELP